VREEALYAENLITKQANQQNLDRVTFSLSNGEIFGITGLNGSGLSTLADVLTGKIPLSGGTIYVWGNKVRLGSREQANAVGIYDVRHSISIIPTLSLSENLNVLGRNSLRRFIINPRLNADTTRTILEYYHLGGSPEEKAGYLSSGQCAQLSICRAVLCGAQILVCQEMGEGFNENEELEFGRFLRQLRDEGIPIIMINSDVRKLLRYADRIAVMRNGMICYCRETREVDPDILCRCMSAPQPLMTPMLPPQKIHQGPSVRLVRVCPAERQRSFINAELRPGRALGLFWDNGNIGNLVFRMFSGTAPASGDVWVGKKCLPFRTWRRKNAKEILCLGIRFWETHLFENLTAAENLLFRSYSRYDRRGGMLPQSMLQLALREFAAEQEIDLDMLELYPRHLPPELRYQLVLWSALFLPPKILVLDNPLYTADEYMRNNFLICMAKLKAAGTTILWSSNEQMALKSYCDQVITIARETTSE
jgi:ABC-type sugar transport system ATPase subunit